MTHTGASRRDLEHLLLMLDQAYNRQSWHGTNLRGAIRGLSPAQAAWRPARGRHNIHELVVHAAYWKYAVWRRLTGSKRGTFPLQGSNWFKRGDARDDSTWRADIALLDRTHLALREAVAHLSSSTLDRPLPASALTPLRLITGAAAHDLYHAGQIQLLKTLHRVRRASR